MRADSARKAPLNACFASKNAEGFGGAFVVCGHRLSAAAGFPIGSRARQHSSESD
ncbi:MAG: hypothetical protein HFH11_08760 [Dorea sp.]|jgi:hypothetical protein|nr:hypothetical protein [Dorea sp.]